MTITQLKLVYDYSIVPLLRKNAIRKENMLPQMVLTETLFSWKAKDFFFQSFLKDIDVKLA